MIIYNDKRFVTCNKCPSEDWTGEALYVVSDDSELAEKIIKLYPHYDFVIADGKLVDVVEVPPPPLTDEELNAEYEARTMSLIHEQYSYDDENKIMREYLSDTSNLEYKRAFDEYNNYVLSCKEKARKEIYNQ